MNPVLLFLKIIGELWISSWKSSPSDTAAAVKGSIDVGSAAATGSRLFSFLNASLSSGMMGITMLTMAVTTTLAAVSVTYDVFINEESNLQVQTAEFDSGVITDERGNTLQHIEAESVKQTALTAQDSFIGLLQAVAEPNPEFTIVSWVLEVDERFLVIEPEMTVPIIVPEPDTETISVHNNAETDIPDTPSVIPVYQDLTPVVMDITPVTDAPLIENAVTPEDTAELSEDTSTPPEDEVTTTPPEDEVTTTPPEDEVIITPPEDTTTPPEDEVTIIPPITPPANPPITPPANPPITPPTQPPVKSNQSALMINEPGAKTFGDSSFTLSVSGGTTDGTVTFERISGSSLSIAANGYVIIENAGETRIRATMAGNENYNEVSAELIITVNKRDLSVVYISIPSGTYTYTGLAHTPSPNVADGASSNLITNADYNYSHGANIRAGTDEGSITVTATASGNYTGTRTVYFNIEKAPLTVTAHDKEIEFNAPPPQFTYTIMGFVNNENEVSALITGEPSLTSAYVQGMPAGDYMITAAISSLYAPNYDFKTFINGSLSVGLTAQNTLNITDVPSSITFGDADFTLGTSGGSGTGSVTWTVTSGTAVSVNSASGSITVLEAGTAVIRATKAGDGNFSSAYAETTLTVEAKSIAGLSIIVNSLQYNGTPLSPTVTIDGLVQGTDFTYSFTPQTDRGNYNFDITGIGNYTGIVNEEFIITPAQLTIAAAWRNDAFNPSILTPLERYIAYDIIVSGDIFGTDSIALGSSNALLESSVPVNVTDAVRTGIFTLGYNGTTAVPTGEISTNLIITNTANYVFSASSVSVSVIDGQHANRPIPVTNSNLQLFNNYARGSGYPAGGQGRHYKLTENVSITAPFIWASIGNDAVPFTGTFDGQGFVISGMARPHLGNSDVGMFGVIGTSGEVRNIGLANINVTGMNNIGGIAGRNRGLIENCFVSGVISGENYVGGIVGSNNGVLQNNVSLLTSVTATLGDTNTARVAGSNSGGTVQNNFAQADMLVNNAIRTGTANDINGADITTATLADANDNLAVFATKTPSNRPDLSQFLPPPPTGSGTAADPWRIYNAADLQEVGRGNMHNGGTWGLNHHYRLENNITLDENNNNNWTPIGAFNQTVSNNNGFLGTFDGQNHTISGLRINYTTSGGNADLGFFASVSENGVVKNVHFTNAIVISNTNATGSTGGVVANMRMNALVQNVSFTGTVTSNRYRTGGIVGTLDNGTIENSIFNGTVTGGGPGWDNASFTGGIAGQMQANGGTIRNCFSTGNVTSTAGRGVGGILGNAEGSGTIENNYSTSTVSGVNDVGGIVGRAGAVTSAVRNNVALNPSVTGTTNVGRIVGIGTGTLNNNYARADMSGSTAQFNATGLTGKDGEDITQADYEDVNWWINIAQGWDFTDVWEWDDVIKLPRLRGKP